VYFSFNKVENFGCDKMGNNSVADIVRTCDICFLTNVGCLVVLKNVKHILHLSMHLTSISTLDNEGYKHKLGEGTWKFAEGSLLVARGKLCYMLYKTHMHV